jgi:hypothetical protein
MPHLPPTFVLFITEPKPATRRAIQIRGLPFTLGSTPEAAVPLRSVVPPSGATPTLVRIEESPSGLRVVDVAGDGLHCDGLLAESLPLTHGSVFEVGDARVRFLVGTRESLRQPRRRRAATDPALPVAEHLRNLERLETRVGELRQSLGARRARAVAARV